MSYYISKTIETTFDDAIQKVTDTLKEVGFGLISTIDIQEKLKEKLDVDFKRYVILGACNPAFAYKALQIEDKIGVMLPCNVILQDVGDGKVEVAAVDPMESMQAIQNEELGAMAGEVKEKLTKAINNL